MYSILKQDNSIGAFETRELPLEELAHENLRFLYIEIPKNNTLKIGDIWHEDKNEWEIVELPDAPIAEPVLQTYQSTNSEIAQMVNDLKADLIISGVIL